MNPFEDLQKKAEEGTRRWEEIDKLAKELNLAVDSPLLTGKLLLALVDYMRPMAPTEDIMKKATADIQEMLASISGKTNV